MAEKPNLVSDLQSWYLAQCNGDWEHDYGVTINSLDNPGWSVIIDLTGTWLEYKDFEAVKVESESNWIDCYVSDKKFQAFCGPTDLENALPIFLDWAKTIPAWLEPHPETPEMLAEQLQQQARWDALKLEPQAEKCRTEGCNRKRIQYTLFCRSHHYEQLYKRPVAQGTYEIWIYGRDESVKAARTRIFDSVREIYGNAAVRNGYNSGATTITIEWLKAPVELTLLDVPQQSLPKITPNEPGAGNADLLLRLFFQDIVEPIRNTTGGLVATINAWTPTD